MSSSPTSLSNRSKMVMVLAAACWGLGTVFSKGLLEHIPPIALLVIQLLASISFLWTMLLLQRRRQTAIPLGKLLWLSAPGLLEPGFAYTLSTIGLTMTTASSAVLIGTTEPAMVIGLAYLLLREQIGLPLLLLSGVAIAGVLLTVGYDLSFSDRALLGDSLIAAGTLCAAMYVVLSRRSVENFAPLPVAAMQQSVGLVWTLLVWLVVSKHEFRQSEPLEFTEISVEMWMTAIASGIVQYAIAFWLYLIALKGIPASVAAQFLSLIPVFGVCGAYLLLGERLTVMQGFGMALIVLAVSQISRLKHL